MRVADVHVFGVSKKLYRDTLVPQFVCVLYCENIHLCEFIYVLCCKRTRRNVRILFLVWLHDTVIVVS